MMARIMTVVMADTVAGSMLTGDAQARGGGGGHGGGRSGGIGGFGGAHMGGARMGSFGGPHISSFGGAAARGIGRGFHGHQHPYGAYSPRYGYGYGYGDLGIAPLNVEIGEAALLALSP
jgi:hypothetical protein